MTAPDPTLVAIQQRAHAAEFMSFQHEEAAASAHDVPYLLDQLRAATDALAAEKARVKAVRALVTPWTTLAPEDDWGESIDGTIQADLGRAVLRALAPAPGKDQQQ